MGTSSSGSGPGKSSPLFPNWNSGDDFLSPENSGDAQNPNPDNQAQTPEQDSGTEPAGNNSEQGSVPPVEQPYIATNWGGVKTSLARIVNNGSGRRGYKKLAKGYGKNVGGAKNAVKASRSGISGGVRIADILGSFGTQGLNATLTELGLSSWIGKSAEEIFAKLSNEICPIGSTNEDAITRKAMLDTLASLYNKFVDGDNVTLDNLQESDIRTAVTEYASYYIYHKWLYELGIVIENKQISEQEVLNCEAEIKAFIFDEVNYEFGDKNILSMDFTTGEGKEIIEDIFEQAYSTLFS